MSFEAAQAVADAVLFEGYALYPYRASAPKNRFRWTFGVLAPRAWSEAGGCEAWWLEAQCLLEPGPRAALRGRLRFLHARRRRLEARGPEGGSRTVDALEAGGRLLLPWEEGDLRELDFEVPVAGAAGPVRSAFEVPGAFRTEPVIAPDRGEVGRIVHEQSALRARLCAEVEPVPAARPLVRIRVRVENETPWDRPAAARAEALAAALLSTHLVLSAADGAVVSLLDPPGWARDAAAACRNTRLWPVLAGAPGRRDLLLAAPIILYDHPQVAPESPGDSFDATEIDELLALRTATLTQEEKRQVRATDARIAAVLERADNLSPELLRRLHGAARRLSGGEMVPLAEAAAPALPAGLAPGRRVRLLAPTRRADAQDLLHVGRTAVVEEIVRDVDGEPQLAVTIDGDPGADLHRWYGRYHYYRPDEVEPLDDGEASP
jgi:hypothetical protein